MSTKIYDAYKFDRKYTLDELMSITDKWRKDIIDIAEKQFAEMCFKLFAYYYDLADMDIAKYADTSKNHIEKQIYNTLADINSDKFSASLLMLYITDILRNDMNDTKSSCNNMMSHHFKGNIQIFTVAKKILFMYFGSPSYRDYIANQPNVQDYHYQNSTDRPENISAAAWDRRYKNWDKAIGPDYVPANHGISVNFINPDGLEFSIFNKYLKKGMATDDSFPSIKERASTIVGKMILVNDYPKDLTKDNSNTEISKWKDLKIKEIMGKLNPHLGEIYNKE